MIEAEWEIQKFDCAHFTGSFWKGWEYCWHQGWIEALKEIGKNPETNWRWCDYDWCPFKNKENLPKQMFDGRQ